VADPRDAHAQANVKANHRDRNFGFPRKGLGQRPGSGMTVVVNSLAGLLPMNGQTPGEIAARFPANKKAGASRPLKLLFMALRVVEQ